MIEMLDKKLSVAHKQWAMLNLLAKLSKVDSVDLAVWNPVTDKWMQFLGLGLCSASIEQALEKVRAMNNKGEDVMVRPERWVAACIIMLDDLTLAQAKAVAGNYNHILVITSIDPETRKERTHLWIQTDRPVTEEERKLIQEVLIGEYNSDKGCKSGEHFGRLNGFRSNKRGGQWVNLYQYRTDGGVLAVDALLAAHPSFRSQAAQVAPAQPAPAGVSPLPPGGSVLVPLPLTVVPAASPAPVHAPKAEEQSGYNPESRKIWACVCECLKKGIPDPNIIKQIAPRILSSGIRRNELQAFREAERTVEKAKLQLGR